MRTIKMLGKPKFAGKTVMVCGACVEYATHNDGVGQFAIEYHKYTADYSRYSSRPFTVLRTGICYGTLESAVKAYLKLTGSAA